jgi:hypothetical protein
VYLARLPLEGFGADADTLRSKAVRFNLLVNDDDGGGREGFAFLAPGLGLGKAEPDKWPLLRFR